MSGLIAFWSAAALMAMLATAPATAEVKHKQYIGTTSEVFDGARGYFAPHQACWGKFEAVRCTSQQIIEHGPHPKSFGPPKDGAWVNPVPIGFVADEFPPFRMLDFSTFIGQPDTLNCNR